MRERPDGLLLQVIKEKMPELEKLYEENSSHWNYEDMVYRYYHGSFKVFRIQYGTTEMVKAFYEIYHEALTRYGNTPDTLKDRKLNEQFLQLVEDGTGKSFTLKHNQAWEKHTRPMVLAFFQTRHVLEMMIKYGKELEEAVSSLPSGWATVLYIFNMR